MNKDLYLHTISDANIFNAIYSLESYVFEKDLLSKSDYIRYNKLKDKYNIIEIEKTISLCRKKLKKILNSNKLFDIEVYFKPKKLNKEDNKPEFRPIHTTDLISQICIVSLLNPIMFNDYEGGRKLSDLSRLIPSNFYGNIPSTSVDKLFEPWNKKYHEYSENAIEAHREYNNTGKYTGEINLDLKKFFPSINPLYIYNFILNNLPITYTSDDKKWMKIILKKLLLFNIKNIEQGASLYYPEDPLSSIQKNKTYYNIGIPQGLPQAYFFGNMCMLIIAHETNKIFKGDSYYYVDDSIIYSNSEKQDFHNNISTLNTNINDQIADQIKKDLKVDSLFDDNPKYKLFHEQIKYEIGIHNDTNGKSTITDITPKDPLYFLAKPASTISFEIKSASDELEDSSLYEKVKAIIDAINYLIKNETSSNNLKLLQRYRKFYTFRLKTLTLRKDNDINKTHINIFYEHYGINTKTRLNVFFERLEDDIFIFECQILLDYLQADPELQEQILTNIVDFESKLVVNEISNHYISKVIKSHISHQDLPDYRYDSIKKITTRTIEPFIKVDREKQIKFIGSLIDTLSNLESEASCSSSMNRISILLNTLKENYSKFVFKYSPEYLRNILNALLSKSLNVEINDHCNFVKLDNRAILYYELRLLMFIRSRNFELDAFINFAKQVLIEKSLHHEKVDLSLFEILPTFKSYVKSPTQIDQLILAHKYVNGIWKNGSKFLHFYTLHNEEHSIELIKNSTKITKTIDYLSLKETDYFILFLSCYLHDVSMVLYPNLDGFSEANSETDIIYSSWKNKITNLGNIETQPKSEIKKTILEFYKEVNDYFEKNIRDNHHKQSSKFIKEQNDLAFIPREQRQLIADVSEAHCYNADDVYKLKSYAKDDTYNQKYLMIILRIADLLDMSKDRVSINILRKNIKNMSSTSRYHWISHLAIDNCSLQSKFKVIKEESNAVYRVRILETVQVHIDLNTKLLTTIKNNSKCDHFRCELNNDESSNSMTIKVGMQEECSGHCNFMCKWIIHKQKYMFDELLQLQLYLERNVNNIFKTEFEVHLHFDNTTFLPSDYMDVIKNKIIQN